MWPELRQFPYVSTMFGLRLAYSLFPASQTTLPFSLQLEATTTRCQHDIWSEHFRIFRLVHPSRPQWTHKPLGFSILWIKYMYKVKTGICNLIIDTSFSRTNKIRILANAFVFDQFQLQTQVFRLLTRVGKTMKWLVTWCDQSLS